MAAPAGVGIRPARAATTAPATWTVQTACQAIEGCASNQVVQAPGPVRPRVAVVGLPVGVGALVAAVLPAPRRLKTRRMGASPSAVLTVDPIRVLLVRPQVAVRATVGQEGR